MRVGHNSTFTNPDAVWRFKLIPEGGENASVVDGAALHFRWDNDAGGTGWQNEFRYVITIRRGSATGEVVKQHANNLSGKSGNWDVDRSDWGFIPNVDYYFCLNVKETPLSSLKSFSTTASVDHLRSRCIPPTSIKIGDGAFRTYRKAGEGATLEIIGGGGGVGNAFTRWYIEELIFSDAAGTLVSWHPARNGQEQDDPAIYNTSSRTVTIYPTRTKGENKRYRIRAEGAVGDPFNSNFAEFGPNICTNRSPNTCTNISVNKVRVVPGEGIRLSFSGGGDPDGNLWMYEVRTLDKDGNVQATKELGRQYDLTKNYVDINLGLEPSIFAAGTKWKFQVRGHDGIEAGPWSDATPFVEIGGIVHVNDSSGTPKDALVYVYDAAGTARLAVPYCFNANGAPKIGI